MDISIRKGTREDLPAALNLIRELAEYEHAADEVEVTVAELERDGFGPKKIFDFFVAVTAANAVGDGESAARANPSGGQVVGLALYYTKYSTWKGACLFLEDLVVQQDYRRYGVGQQLFDAVKAVAHERGCKRFEWQVLDWNEPAINFYKKNKALLDSEWINCKLVNP